ncbi:hypothetical protein DU249_26105, partial [Salmonella enterica subsp. diarizonae]|nr:hypothetical protein [Salmonella enterica subsp. diarizonae]
TIFHFRMLPAYLIRRTDIGLLHPCTASPQHEESKREKAWVMAHKGNDPARKGYRTKNKKAGLMQKRAFRTLPPNRFYTPSSQQLCQPCYGPDVSAPA